MADGRITIDTKIDKKGAEKGLSDLQKSVEGTSKKMKKVGTNMSKYITAPLVALGAVGFAAADQLDKAYRNIQVGTGATGDALEDLKSSFKEVFENVPESADQVSNALAAMNTLTGETGKNLEDLTQSVLDASRSLGEDGVSNASAFGRVMQQWQIPAKDGVDVLDQLFKATQDYDVGLGQISSHLTEYGSVLQNAGFNMQESADLMGRLEKSGISVSRIMPGLNMAFRNWASEGKNSREEFDKVISKMQDAGSETEALALATEAFGAEGAQRLTTGVRTGAIPALDELGKSMDNTNGLIQETTDETKTVGEKFRELKNNTMTALEPLGEILIDLAQKYLPPLIDAVTELAEWFQNLSPHIQKAMVIFGAIAAVLGPIIVVIGTIAGAVINIISVFSTLMPIIKLVGTAFSIITTGPLALVAAGIAALIAVGILLWKNWDTVKEYAIITWTAIKDFFATVWEGIKSIFTWYIETTRNNLNATWTWIKNTTMTIWNAIKEFFSVIWEGIKGVFDWYITTTKNNLKAAWDFIKNVTSTVWNGIKTFFSDLWEKIKSVVKSAVDSVKNKISNVWNTIKSTTSSIWNGIKSTVTDVWDNLKSKVKSAFNTIKDTISGVWDDVESSTDKIWDGITGSVKSAINGVISAINGMINALNGLSIPLPTIPDWVPGMGGKGGGSISFPNIPNIPSLDVGTNLVKSDGLAMIHKGEQVVPAKHSGPYKPSEGEGATYEIPVTLDLDGETLVQKTIRMTSRELENQKKTSARGRGTKTIWA
ncbi:phage tail tape measure protein [Paraliobacillus ryukyuensis]|uniref:phage tail tape measure protein n=1 Tax=Paraliobacillus ryukyuensis TaxID=200904 RepID=UPI0009A8D991|nr:phage tail tape measure protein [Paraliobacillus ryukyuensis]